jgi:hypothetical protein
MVAAVLAGLFSGARRPGAMMAAAACVWGGAIAGFGVTRSLPTALVLLVIAGGALLILPLSVGRERRPGCPFRLSRHARAICVVDSCFVVDYRYRSPCDRPQSTDRPR